MGIQRFPGATLTAFAKETLSVGTVPKQLTASIYAPTVGQQATYAFITVETDAIRFWMDGSEPTSSEGHSVAADSSIEIHGPDNVRNFSCVRVTNDATIQVTYAK